MALIASACAMTSREYLSSAACSSRFNEGTWIRRWRRYAYPDTLPVGLGIRLASHPIFGEVLLRSRHVHDGVFQGLLVREPFFSCTLERTFRLSEGRSSLRELLLNVRKIILKGFLQGLQVGINAKKGWANRTAHTQETESWDSVVVLYSSCVVFNDARASSLAWLISLNCWI